MAIDLTKIAVSSSTPGLQNTAQGNFTYAISSQTLTTSNQQFTESQIFPVNAGFQFIYAQFQMPGLDSTWRVLNGGKSVYDYNSSNVFAPTGTNAYSVQFTTFLSSNTIIQTLLLQYQNSPNPVTIPAFTVNLKVFVLKAPF